MTDNLLQEIQNAKNPENAPGNVVITRMAVMGVTVKRLLDACRKHSQHPYAKEILNNPNISELPDTRTIYVCRTSLEAMLRGLKTEDRLAQDTEGNTIRETVLIDEKEPVIPPPEKKTK